MSRIRADRRVGLLLAGVVLLVFVALGASVALPATDPSLDVPEPEELTREEARGMEIYRSEGCWYCHTQYVRSTATDRALSDESATGPEAYAGLSPAMIGLERIGPDVSTMTVSAEAIEQHGGAGSLSYLSARQLEALAAYLRARQ